MIDRPNEDPFKVREYINKKCRDYREGELIMAKRKRLWLREKAKKATTLQERLIYRRLIVNNLDRIDMLSRILKLENVRYDLNEERK